MNPRQPTARTVLAVAAHADDEVLGAGGTLAAHARAGNRVRLLVLSASATSRPAEDHDAVHAHRSACVARVAALYDAEFRVDDLPDNAFDTVPRLQITRRIEQAVHAWRPQIVYTHSRVDLSLDHRITADAVAAATRPQPGTPVATVLAWEVRSATEWGSGEPFRPAWFQPLTPQDLAVKDRALRLYGSELRAWPHSRSHQAIRAAAQVRGAQIGVAAAEAFEVVRHVVTADG
ncbi:PIG-L deacetylase family protein [Amycolatopsis sp. NPDC004079]|uniref:PIG-L deacetylase family protein n=1 Tax=Amycolatopsis sp. NPDC004079 TaxID=3154549 RepID=UPI0033A80F35